MRCRIPEGDILQSPTWLALTKLFFIYAVHESPSFAPKLRLASRTGVHESTVLRSRRGIRKAIIAWRGPLSSWARRWRWATQTPSAMSKVSNRFTAHKWNHRQYFPAVTTVWNKISNLVELNYMIYFLSFWVNFSLRWHSLQNEYKKSNLRLTHGVPMPQGWNNNYTVAKFIVRNLSWGHQKFLYLLRKLPLKIVLLFENNLSSFFSLLIHFILWEKSGLQ
jgi:hypothetical protein